MGTLTVKEIENAKPKSTAYKLSDGAGLYLRVTKDGAKKWVVRYMFDGVERQYLLHGLYGFGAGRLGLKEAREEATRIRALARQGVNIAVKVDEDRIAELHRQEENAAKSKTLEDLFAEWVKTVDRKDGGKELQRSFARDVFPQSDQSQLCDVHPHHIEKMLRGVVERGSHRSAVTLFSDLKQMFRWAARKRAWKSLFENPTEEIDLKEILPKSYIGAERTRALTSEEVRDLAQKLPTAHLMPQTQIAIWIILSCCCRIGEVMQARWEHVNLETGVWTIPKENSKNKKEHTIFLSSFALARFTDLRRIAQSATWCFPDKTGTTFVCTKSATKQIRDRQLTARGRKPMINRTKLADALLLLNGDWVPHDLRRTGATFMQSLKVAPAIIERVLNHVEPSKLVRTYQTYDYAEEKRDAWNRLGAFLDALLLCPEYAVLLRNDKAGRQ